MTAEIFSIIAPVLLGATLGYGWARFGPAFNTQMLTSLVLVIGTPCLVFSTLTKFSVDLFSVGDMALASLASLAIILTVGSAILFMTRQPVRAFLPSLMFPNAGNMGLPLCLFAFGDEGLALGIAFFTVTSLGNFTLGVWLASGKISTIQLLRTPLIWAAVAAIIFLAVDIKPPIWLSNTTRLIGDFTIPAILRPISASQGPEIIILLPVVGHDVPALGCERSHDVDCRSKRDTIKIGHHHVVTVVKIGTYKVNEQVARGGNVPGSTVSDGVEAYPGESHDSGIHLRIALQNHCCSIC